LEELKEKGKNIPLYKDPWPPGGPESGPRRGPDSSALWAPESV